MMKKVVQSTPVVTVDNVADNKFYGVLAKGDVKCFISRKDFNDGDFIVRSSRKLTQGNSYDSFNNNCLRTMITKLVEHENFEVFEFDTAKELFKWLAE